MARFLSALILLSLARCGGPPGPEPQDAGVQHASVDFFVPPPPGPCSPYSICYQADGGL